MTDFVGRFEGLRQEHWGEMATLIDGLLRDVELESSTVATMLAYHLQTGGKRLRAILPLMVAEALGVERERMIPFGAACELIHNATLVHDDLQDGDRIRRGEATVWAHYGEAQAINLGDALLYLAPLCLERFGGDDGAKWRAAQRIFRDILQVIDGQEREFSLQGALVEREAYERMVVGKTSGLFALPLAGAAELCGADEELVRGLEEAARELGVLFQIQDDVLDLFGEKGRAERGADIREGKISMLVVAFKECAAGDEFERLVGILEKDREATTDAEVRWAIDAIRGQGALSRALESIEERRAKVLANRSFKDYPEIKNLMEGLVEIFLRPISNLMPEHCSTT